MNKQFVLAKINRAINNQLEDWICEVYEKYKSIIERTKPEEVDYTLINTLRKEYFRELYSSLPKEIKGRIDQTLNEISGASTETTKKFRSIEFKNIMLREFKVLDFWFV